MFYTIDDISFQHVHLVVMGRTVCLTVTVVAAHVIRRMENVYVRLDEWVITVNRVHCIHIVMMMMMLIYTVPIHAIGAILCNRPCLGILNL